MSLGSGKDLAIMARAMGLDNRQEEFCYSLKIGQAVSRLSGLPSFPFGIPLVRMRKDVDDHFVEAAFRGSRLPFKPRRVPKEVETYFQSLRGKTDGNGRPHSNLSRNAISLLASLITHPFLGITERYQACGLTVARGDAAKQELLAAGLIREVNVKKGQRGRKAKLLEMTTEGAIELEGRGFETRVHGKGGLEHRYWQERIADYYRTWGCIATIEQAFGQDSVDVFVKRPDGKVIAIEIAMNSRNEVSNARKCIELGVYRLVIACRDEEVLETTQKAVLKALSPEEAKRVFFCLVGRYTDGKDGKEAK
jgi:hypothetical protein